MRVAGLILLQILNFIFGIIGLSLGLRIVLKLFAASAQAPAIDWLYDVTDNLLFPFQGVFPNISVGTSGVLDVVALIGLTAYSIVFYIIAGVVRSVVYSHSVAEEEHAVHRHT